LKRKIYKEGDVFAMSLCKTEEEIPYFLPPYAFGRLISFEPNNHRLIEIFNYYGEMTSDIEMIIRSGRLFDPVSVMDYLYKKRWKVIFMDKNFDKESVGYSKIKFSLGFDTLVWEGGKTRPIKKDEIKKYKWMVIYAPVQVEELIREYINI
jgi:hypothetical protein